MRMHGLSNIYKVDKHKLSVGTMDNATKRSEKYWEKTKTTKKKRTKKEKKTMLLNHPYPPK
jgi:hypothetical protein